MNRISLLALGAALIAGVAAAAPALADRTSQAELNFEAIDADADGVLNRAELEAFGANRLAEFDANGDGFLDREELIAMMPAPRDGTRPLFGIDQTEARADRMLERMDATEASRIEIAAMLKGRIDRVMTAWDRDEDGTITRTEADHARERMVSRMDRRDERRDERVRPHRHD